MHLHLTADYIYNTDMSYNVYLREKMYFIHREETQTPPLMSTLSSESIEWGHMLYPLLCQHISTFTAPHSIIHTSMPMKWMAEGWEWSLENAFATISVSKSPLININPRRKAPEKMSSVSPSFLHLLCLSLFLTNTTAKCLPHSISSWLNFH